jgi:hypothetical protein
MIEKLRIFFIYGRVWTNLGLYRSTHERECLMYLLDVQMPVADQLPAEQQDRYFVPVARARGRIAIHVEHIDGMRPRRRQVV